MISEKTLQHPLLVTMVFLLLGIIGLFTISNIPLALFPDVDSPYLMVMGTYANAGPETVEKTVTSPIEDALIGVSNLKNITSTSSEGSCRVSLEFNYGTDLESATNDVRDKLERVNRSLPDGVSTSIMKFSSNSMPIIRIAVRGNRSADDLKLFAENSIVDVLEQADGVGEAEAMGGRTKIIRVELEQNRLQAYHLPLTTVAASLAKQNIELGGGTITDGTTNYSIRTTGEYESVRQINDTVVTTINGYDVKVSDLGRAYMGYSDASNEVYINGQPGVYVSITKASGANTVSVSDAIKAKMEELKDSLPSDISMEIVSDQADSIRDTLNTLFDSAWQGLILAVVVLYVFLCSVKSTFIIAIAIPLSIVITVLCMNFAGLSLNMLTLTGLILGVGMIVDASIVMIDNIYSYRSRGAKPKIAAILGSSEMLMSVLSGNLTTICVFVPFLFFLKDLGMMGQMFKGIIFTIVIALVSSLFVATFLVPVLAGVWFPLTNRNEKPVKSFFFKALYGMLNGIQDALTAVYRVILRAALRHRIITVLICVAALVFALMQAKTLNVQMMTGGQDSSVTLNIKLPIGTSLEATEKIVYAFQDIAIDEIKGYKNIITTVGKGGRRGSTNSGSIEINLPDSAEQIDSASVIQNKLRAHFNDYADVTFSFGRGMRQQMAGDDLDIEVKSASMENAVAVANLVADVMNAMEDIDEASVDINDGLPQVEIKVDRVRAYNFGVSVSAIASEIQSCVNGKTATTYRENGEDYTVSVMLQDADVSTIPDLSQIYVASSKGSIPISSVAEIVKGTGPVTISHENRSRIVHVTAGILSDEKAAVVAENIKNNVAQSVIIPDGVSVHYGGSFEDVNEQTLVYLKIGIMALLLVFGVMAATYESIKAPIINLTTIPFLIIGVVFIYKITNQPFSMVGAIGIIMLIGIVVNNGIILVDYTNLLIDRGVRKMDACLEAGTSRLRPVLMTTLTTILGMLPMCFASSGSAGMMRPIGMAVVGGLTSSTFITLLFIPVFYSLIMGEKKTSESRIKVTLPTPSAPKNVPTQEEVQETLSESPFNAPDKESVQDVAVAATGVAEAVADGHDVASEPEKTVTEADQPAEVVADEGESPSETEKAVAEESEVFEAGTETELDGTVAAEETSGDDADDDVFDAFDNDGSWNDFATDIVDDETEEPTIIELKLPESEPLVEPVTEEPTAEGNGSSSELEEASVEAEQPSEESLPAEKPTAEENDSSSELEEAGVKAEQPAEESLPVEEPTAEGNGSSSELEEASVEAEQPADDEIRAASETEKADAEANGVAAADETSDDDSEEELFDTFEYDDSWDEFSADIVDDENDETSVIELNEGDENEKAVQEELNVEPLFAPPESGQPEGSEDNFEDTFDELTSTEMVFDETDEAEEPLAGDATADEAPVSPVAKPLLRPSTNVLPELPKEISGPAAKAVETAFAVSEPVPPTAEPQLAAETTVVAPKTAVETQEPHPIPPPVHRVLPPKKPFSSHATRSRVPPKTDLVDKKLQDDFKLQRIGAKPHIADEASLSSGSFINYRPTNSRNQKASGR